MAESDSGDGSARLLLVDGIALLHPEDAVLDAMLEGWARQQRGGRRLRPKTISDRQSCVRRFVAYTNEYPWTWTAGHLDEWMTSLIAGGDRAEATIRNYQGSIRQFCDYITSPYYEWAEVCQERFGTHPVQICHEWNTVAHLVDYEAGAERRPMTREECQALFDYADERVERAVRLGRKGALTAYRDATVFKTIYGWGLRCQETSGLDLTDFYRNPKAPELGRFGSMHVRYGKRTKGSPPRRRMVLSIMPWAVESLQDYIVNIHPRFRHSGKSALWVTERGGRLQPREIEDRFAEYRDALGMDDDLTPHCLRHSYVTHNIEDGADPQFIQQQVGHRFASTTAIYTGVSGDFMNTMMRRVLDRALEANH
ncbi:MULTISPECIES: tyrosine-type recombinase/integrase [unclassified Streptomyces]|uniref:tyrosine-type recombinase/integrase n=1 Tax=unclassified Streptomyces TaxID=2593676 RepID=UPI00224DB6ED|nr:MULTISPECIES: tyrosine-type recombinase/integrase [unclassified Streptomyces]MCX4405893.1 tyrosine-type recombinase/integrase [Streptomyces sp. NBC_01764]MCX5189584.1 tyrosine-type recombinase/integrase [Streptomyces sp. NBC_00268]